MGIDPKAAALAGIVGLIIAVFVYWIVTTVASVLAWAIALAVLAVAVYLVYRRVS